MKLTWFGNGSFRVHAGGAIVVVDGEAALEGVDRAELAGGADRVVGAGDSLPFVDGVSWKARKAGRLLDVGEEVRPVELFSLGEGTMLVDADGERPLLVLTGEMPGLGRWVERAVVVVAGADMARRAGDVAAKGPRLLALAGDESEVEAAFAALREGLDGTGLMALEPGLAVEV